MMDLDKLKTCAKALGYKVDIWDSSVSYQAKDGYWYKYDPEHNDAQAFELLKWLIKQGKTDFNGLFGIAKVRGWTINQAVIEAVWEVKK